MGVTSKMCSGDHLLWRVVISSSSGSWIDISALSFCAVLIVSVLSFCVRLRVSTRSFCVASCVCSHCSQGHRLAPAFLYSFLSRFVSVCLCLLVRSVPHRRGNIVEGAFTRIVLCRIVLHLCRFSRITCIAAAASGSPCTVLR